MGQQRHQQRRQRATRGGRTDAAPTSAPDASADLRLQRAAGNQAVSALIEGAQAKLTVGDADDPLEHEADAVAAAVVDSIRSGTVTAATAGRAIARRPAPAGGTASRSDAPDGRGGGPVDDQTEARILTGGGSPLPAPTRQPLEQAFGGADFRDVRVHTDADSAELTAAMGADAFTVGADIFLRDGLPDATDPLLAHELTHVVQQGGAAPAARRGDGSHAPGSIRRLWNPFKKKRATPTDAGDGDTAGSAPAGPVDTRAPNAIKVPKMTGAYALKGDMVETAATTTVIRPGTQIVVDYARSLRKRAASDDPDAPPGYVPIRSGTGATGEDLAGRYVRLSAIDGTASATTSSGVDTAVEGLGQASSLYGTVGDVSTAASDSDTKVSEGADTQAWERDLAGHADNLAYASGSGDIAGMFVTLAASIRTFKDTDKNRWEKGEAGLNAVQSLGAGAKGIAGIVDTATDSAGKSAEAVGGLGMFTGIFDGIKATFKVVKKAMDLAREATKQEKTNQERFHDTMEIVTGLLEAAKSGVSTAKTFLDTFSSGPNAALTNSVPGFGIAIGAADMIVRSVDMVYAKIHSNAMRKQKRSLKELLGGVKGKSSEDMATKRMEEIDRKRGTGVEISADEEQEYETASEYLLAKGVQYINDKRINRGILKMSVAMGKVSGDVATLGGASAPVGIGLKAGAMALDVGASVFRKFKQWARDKKAAKEKKRAEKGQGKITTGFWSVFDSDKSSAAKLKKYNRMVDKIFDMIVVADSLPPPDPDTRFKGVDKYVRAMGMRPSKLYELRSDPVELRAEMITAMKQRE